MKHILSLLLLGVSLSLTGQPLRDINYSYLYDPTSDFSFDLKVVRGTEWNVFYKLEVKDTSMRAANYMVQWETRAELSDKEGTAFLPEVNILQEQKTLSSGSFRIATSAAPKILSAKVINSKTKRAWIYYRILSPEYPVVTYLKKDDEVVFKPYVNIAEQVSTASENWIVSYYEDNFPAALPPFSETQGRVNKGMKTDSTFSITGGSVNFSKKGLYLLQKDTSAVEGLAFRSEDDYPRHAKIQSLAGPMVYVCTKQEYDRLVLAKGDKKAFDRIVLGMTADTDRAKKFIRNYFRRVELANQFFTSYKEGWKTDRGMIFIIFGLPDEVLKFSDRETWSYKNDDYNVTFNFSKSPSLFDPENYVLIRDKKYTQTWYEVIDLWRNARF